MIKINDLHKTFGNNEVLKGIDEEIKKEIWYVCKMEHCSAIKKNELLPFAATWRT